MCKCCISVFNVSINYCQHRIVFANMLWGDTILHNALYNKTATNDRSHITDTQQDLSDPSNRSKIAQQSLKQSATALSAYTTLEQQYSIYLFFCRIQRLRRSCVACQSRSTDERQSSCRQHNASVVYLCMGQICIGITLCSHRTGFWQTKVDLYGGLKVVLYDRSIKLLIRH